MRSGGDSCSSKYFCMAVFPWCLLSVVKDPTVEKDALAGDRDRNAKPQDVFGIPHFSGGLAYRKHDAVVHGIHRGGHDCRRNGNAQECPGRYRRMRSFRRRFCSCRSCRSRNSRSGAHRGMTALNRSERLPDARGGGGRVHRRRCPGARCLRRAVQHDVRRLPARQRRHLQASRA